MGWESSSYPPSSRTVAFSLPGQVEASSIQQTLASVGATVSIIDLFAFEDDAGAQRAITFEMAFPNPEGTLSAELCNQRLQQALDAVLSTYSECGVKHR